VTLAVLVDTEALDREALAAVGAACQRVRVELVPLQQAASSGVDSAALIVSTLRKGERRIAPSLVDLMTNVAPDAQVLLISEEPLVRPIVATHNGRVTLLARPTTPARIRGTLRMLLGERGGMRGEHLDASFWTAIVGAHTGELPTPVLRRDAGNALTAVIPLEPGWSGAEELSDDVDLIAQARIEDEERHRRLHEILGHAAGMIHLSAQCRSWVVYWPTTRSPLLLCSPMRLPRMCNIAEAASKHILTLAASPGDLVIALPREAEPNLASLHVTDGGAAFVEQAEGLATLPSPVLVVELR
jgi:hypothetical protein